MGKAGFQATVNGALGRQRGKGERGMVFYNGSRNDCQHLPFNRGKIEWVHRCPHTGRESCILHLHWVNSLLAFRVQPLTFGWKGHSISTIYGAPILVPLGSNLSATTAPPPKEWKSLGLLCFLSPRREWIIMNSQEHKQLFENFPRRLFMIKWRVPLTAEILLSSYEKKQQGAKNGQDANNTHFTEGRTTWAKPSTLPL